MRNSDPRYTESGPVLVQPAVLPRLACTDTIIFDIDGVIMDVTDSIRAVDRDAVHAYLTQLQGWPDTGQFVEPEDIQLYKLTDGFNDDWELTGVNVLTYLIKAELAGTRDVAVLRRTPPSIAELAEGARRSRGGVPHVRQMLLDLLDDTCRRRVLRAWDYEKIVQVFQELYAGEDHCFEFYGYHPEFIHVPGRIALDRPLLRREALPQAPAVKFGIYSGRTWTETRAALTMAGIAGLFARERVIVVDDGLVKPDPRGLAALVERMSSTAAIFVGDMPDDVETVRRYRRQCAERAAGAVREPPVHDCLVRSGPWGGRPEEEIRAAGASIIAPDVNVFLEWWVRIAVSAGCPGGPSSGHAPQQEMLEPTA